MKPHLSHGHAECPETRAGFLIHTLELKLWHYSHMFVCGSHAFAMFPRPPYMSVRSLESESFWNMGLQGMALPILCGL